MKLVTTAKVLTAQKPWALTREKLVKGREQYE
jgi:hypothetical protein